MGMKERQGSDGANAGRSGGVNHQGMPMSADVMTAAPMSPKATVPDKGVSNGGK
jgi:hypothetical protein